MLLVHNQLKKWCHLRQLNACAAARGSANLVKVSSVQTAWRHLMVLKKQDGMRRGQAAILASCICTGWARLSGFFLGRRQAGEKNQGVNNFGLLIPLDISPMPLSASCVPPGVQGGIPMVVGVAGL